MRRNTSLVLGVLVIVFLAGVMMTSIGSTTERISPQELQEGDYEGETVQVEGIINSKVDWTSEDIVFDIAGNSSMANATQARQDFDLESAASVQVVWEEPSDPPDTLQKGRWARVTGEVRDGVLYANQVTVDAHGSSPDAE